MLPAGHKVSAFHHSGFGPIGSSRKPQPGAGPGAPPSLAGACREGTGLVWEVQVAGFSGCAVSLVLV